ncbi:hypothetical protein [Coleofasciculus sp. E1-EBD-02]|uniref:hypothetical protein n=1 Tax=Coleofasciculus sp. E1-EBD-02 TaxID=3068481 RepID=UPI0032FFBBAA
MSSPTTSPAEEAPIPVVLPTLADVELTTGGSKSGRVTAITDKALTLEASGEADSIAIKEIKRVKFSQEAPLPRGSVPRLRGLRGEAEIWRVTPLTALQIKDSSEGLAEVALSAVVKEKQSPPDPLGEPSSYEVKEMLFDANSPGMIRLKVEGIE